MSGINIKSNQLIYPIDHGLKRLSDYIFAILVKIAPSSVKDKIELLRNSNAAYNMIGLTIFNALGGFLLLITQIKLANVLGATVYGIYAYCLAIGEVGANFVRYGRHKTMLRELVQHPERQNSLISNTFILSVLNLFIFVCVIILFHAAFDVPPRLSYFLLIISPCLISLDFQMVYESFNLISWHAIYNFFQKLLFLSPIWIIILFGELSLSHIAVIACFSWAIVLVVQYREITKNLAIHPLKEFHWRALLSLYKENFYITLCCFAGIAFGPLIQMILNRSADSDAVGIYAAGLQILYLSQFFILQIARVGNPKMATVCKSGYDIKGRKDFVKRYIIVMLLAILPFTITLTFFAKTLIETFYSQEYYSLAKILPIFGIYLLLCTMGVVFNQYMISINKDKVYFSIYVCSAVIALLVALLAIPKWGIVGAAFALCLSDGVASICYMIFSIQHLNKIK